MNTESEPPNHKILIYSSFYIYIKYIQKSDSKYIFNKLFNKIIKIIKVNSR